MAEPKLPLIARKNIKENEEKVNEIKEKIAAVVEGAAEVTVDVNYPAFAAFVDKAGYQNRVGEVTVWYLEALSGMIANTFKEETAKAALQGAWTTGVIRLQSGTLKKGEHKYSSLDIDNGDLVITVYNIGNVGDGFRDLLDKLGDSSSGLSLKNAQSFKDKEESRTEALQQIQEFVQLSCDVTLDVDAPAFSAKSDTAGYKDRVGEVIQWYIDAIKENLKRPFKDDELARAALQAAWTTGVIRLEFGTLKKNEYKYVESNIRDGDLVVTVYNIGNVGETLGDLLPKLADPASGLPLRAALNIKEKEEQRDEFLKQIQDAVGLATDVTLDVDWSALEPTLKKSGYGDRMGEVVYNWILGALAGNIVRITKDEMTKEAVAEAWTTGVIRLEENKKISYHAVEFVNGDLIIQYKPENIASNVGSIGSDIESKL
jgi:hypothetical protein